MDRSAAWIAVFLCLLTTNAVHAQSFVPCYDAEGTSLQGMLIGVTATALEGDSCSWLLRYQFQQLQKNLTTLSKLTAIVIDLGTTQQDIVDEYSCWAGCVSDPTYDSSDVFSSSLSYPWRFGFKESSCACMNGNYTFEIALTGVSLQWGAVGVETALGESMICPTISFTPCSSSSEGIDMSGVCPLDDPLGEVDPSTDDCSNITPSPSATPTPSPTASNSSSSGGDGGLSGGAIAGVVVGVVSGVVLVGGVAGAAVGTAGYLAWKAIHQPAMDLSTLDATEALGFQINTAMDNPVYVGPAHIINNAAYQMPI